MLRRTLLFVLLLTLPGCWTGPALFTPADSVRAIPDGRYRMVEPGSQDGGGDVLTIAAQADGSLLVTGPEHPWRVVAAPLPEADPGQFVLQLQENEPTRPERAVKASYMLLDMRGDHPAITMLRCDADTAAAVEASGGFIARDPQSAASCGFSDKPTLKRQIAIAAKAQSEPDIELVRTEE